MRYKFATNISFDKIYLVPLFMLMNVILFGCMKKGGNILLLLQVYPTGSFSDCYEMKIDESRKITMIYGEAAEITDKINFIKEEKRISNILDRDSFQILKEYISNVKKIGTYKDKSIVKDSWRIKIKTTSYEIDVPSSKLDLTPKPIRELFDNLKRISPINIDMHDWS